MSPERSMSYKLTAQRIHAVLLAIVECQGWLNRRNHPRGVSEPGIAWPDSNSTSLRPTLLLLPMSSQLSALQLTNLSVVGCQCTCVAMNSPWILSNCPATVCRNQYNSAKHAYQAIVLASSVWRRAGSRQLKPKYGNVQYKLHHLMYPTVCGVEWRDRA